MVCCLDFFALRKRNHTIPARSRPSSAAPTAIPAMAPEERLEEPELDDAGLELVGVAVAEVDTSMIPISSWVRAKIFLDLDVSPAVIRPGRKEQEGRTNMSGRPVFELSGQTLQRSVIRDVVIIVGRDSDECFWLSLFMAENMVEALQKAVRDERLAM